MNEEIRITRDDLVAWIDRSPSNADLELCDYLVNALDNQFKYYEEIKQLQQENQELKKQLEYLRSGEYLNQLKFERNMLEDIVQNSEVSKEDKEFIDMTHRNTELLEENQSLKSKYNKALSKLVEYNPPCELDGFMDKNIDYCSMNCGVDEEVFKECWNRYIEQQLKESE